MHRRCRCLKLNLLTKGNVINGKQSIYYSQSVFPYSVLVFENVS